MAIDHSDLGILQKKPRVIQSKYINVQDAANYLGVNAALLNKDRQKKNLQIFYYRIGRAIRYSIPELDKWMLLQRDL